MKDFISSPAPPDDAPRKSASQNRRTILMKLLAIEQKLPATIEVQAIRYCETDDWIQAKIRPLAKVFLPQISRIHTDFLNKSVEIGEIRG